MQFLIIEHPHLLIDAVNTFGYLLWCGYLHSLKTVFFNGCTEVTFGIQFFDKCDVVKIA